MGINIDANLANESDGSYTFRVDGELYFLDHDLQFGRGLETSSDLDTAAS
jgi:hypothetical protein